MTNIEQKQNSTFIPFVEMIDETPFLIKDEKGNFESLEKFMNNPTRTRLTETLKSFDCYIDAVNERFAPEDSAIYVRLVECPKYNKFWLQGFVKDCRKEPQWRDDYKVNWDGSITKDARDFLCNDGELLDQEDFALFIDRHLNCITKPEDAGFNFPSQAELLNFVTTLEDSKSKKFSRKINIQNGDVSVSLESQSDDGTTERLKLFERFAVNIQLYEGFPTYQITAKLRFRVKEGQVFFSYDLEGLEDVFNASRDFAIQKLREETGIVVYL